MTALLLAQDLVPPPLQISVGALMIGFVVWGVLMGLAGAAITWVLQGDRFTDEPYEPRPFTPGRIGMPTSEANTTTVIVIPRMRVSDEYQTVFDRSHGADMSATTIPLPTRDGDL